MLHKHLRPWQAEDIYLLGRFGLHGAFRLTLHTGFSSRPCRQPVIVFPLCKPLLREWHTHGKIVELPHLLFHGLIPAAHTEIFHTVQEGRIFFSVGVLNHACQHIRAQKPDLPLLRNAKAGIKPDGVKLVSQNKKAETVYGGDLRIVKQCGLPL